MKIGSHTLSLPLIQGGMGVGVSLSSLAGNVAKKGAMGVISTAQIGFKKPSFLKDTKKANLEAIDEEIKRAKEISNNNGMVAVNVMVALSDYEQHVRQAVKSGVDAIISGAGLPLKLPEYVDEKTAIAPIVSSGKAAHLILNKWKRQYDRTADFIVVEGPEAGGHLGFSKEQLANRNEMDFDKEIRDIIECKKEYEGKFGKEIPVVVAGGIFDRKDIDHVMTLGADGVQIASRFVATKECDADERYKQAYVNAKEEDVQIIQSPVGMPGRAIRNQFVKTAEAGRIQVKKCYNCLEKCNPAQVPYCITKALIDAVKGDVENGLMFCGANVGRIDRITTVHELMRKLAEG